MANIKDFATALIATAPSPATSGTSLVLATGMGARMPAVPFNAVAHPDGQLPTLDNAEQVLVTARTTDTLTITRAQGLTSAKSIATGWRLSNSIFTSDILNASSVTDELMTGTVNGTNKVFTTGSNFTNIQVYKNGVAMHLTDDFTVTGANQITFVTAPATGTKLTASYILGSQTMINGSSSLLQDETPTGTVNGSNTAFTTARPYIANTLEVFINGVKQKRGTHFTETTPTSGMFTMGDAPLTGDDIMVNYQFVQSSYGNADTVDGIHANVTPTANTLLPLDSNGLLPASVHGAAWTSWTPTWAGISGGTNTLGNGTIEAYYTQIGKIVFFRITLTFGSTTTSTGVDWSFSPPVTPKATTGNLGVPIGATISTDFGTNDYIGDCRFFSTNAIQPRAQFANGTFVTNAPVSFNSPFTWANQDFVKLTGFYEAA